MLNCLHQISKVSRNYEKQFQSCRNIEARREHQFRGKCLPLSLQLVYHYLSNLAYESIPVDFLAFQHLHIYGRCTKHSKMADFGWSFTFSSKRCGYCGFSYLFSPCLFYLRLFAGASCNHYDMHTYSIIQCIECTC